MRATVQTRRRRGFSFSTGLLFAILAAIIIFGFGAVNGFHNNGPANDIWGWAILFALFATPLLAGLVSTLRSGRIGAGTLAGLWDGFFVGVVLAAYILTVYFLTLAQSGSNLDLVIQQAQAQIAQQGQHFTITRETIVTTLIIFGVILIVLFLIIGTVLGLIGALIGKIFSRSPRY